MEAQHNIIAITFSINSTYPLKEKTTFNVAGGATSLHARCRHFGEHSAALLQRTSFSSHLYCGAIGAAVALWRYTIILCVCAFVGVCVCVYVYCKQQQPAGKKAGKRGRPEYRVVGTAVFALCVYKSYVHGTRNVASSCVCGRAFVVSPHIVLACVSRRVCVCFVVSCV